MIISFYLPRALVRKVTRRLTVLGFTNLAESPLRPARRHVGFLRLRRLPG
jgi:hypothetical protein